jgi:hypothetical protein
MVGLSADGAAVVIVDVELGGFEPEAKAPNPEVVVFPPKTLGFDAASDPNGEEVEEAKEANPELAKAEEDVCGFALSPLPNVPGAGGLSAAAVSADVLVVSGVSGFVVSCGILISYCRQLAQNTNIPFRSQTFQLSLVH